MKVDRKFVRFLIVQMVLVASISILLSSGMKFIFEQDRPCVGLEDCPEGFSFPSRHTAAAFSIATIFVFYTRNIFYKTLVFIVAALVGYYRIFLGFHTLADIIVGAIVGILVGIIIYHLVKKRKKYKKFFK